MFAGLCTNSDFFNSKINLFIALAPVCRVDQCGSEMVQTVAKLNRAIDLVLKLDYNLMPKATVNRENRILGAGIIMLGAG